MVINIMSGVPASGKSTFAKQNKKADDIYLSRDDWRSAIRKQLNCDTYFPYSQKRELKEWIKFVKDTIATTDKDIWIDQTTLCQSTLITLLASLEIANNDNYKIVVHRIVKPLEVCLVRNKQRSGWERTPDETIEKFWELFTKYPIHPSPVFTNVEVIEYV